MGLGRWLGFGLDSPPGAKEQAKAELMAAGNIALAINGWLKDFDFDMDKLIAADPLDLEWTKDLVYMIVKAYGPKMPTKDQHPEFKQFRQVAKLIPWDTEVDNNPIYQKSWDYAYKWVLDCDYKNSNQAIIDAIKESKNDDNNIKATIIENNKKIEALESRIKNLERKLSDYENE